MLYHLEIVVAAAAVGGESFDVEVQEKSGDEGCKQDGEQQQLYH